MDQVQFIKSSLIEANCPFIQETEDLNSIERLIKAPSNHRKQLTCWMLQEILDLDASNFDNEETMKYHQKSLGINLSSIQGWKMAFKLLKAKETLSNANHFSLDNSRSYLEAMNRGEFTLPIQTNSGSLLPRDIEKDVRDRSANSNDEEVDVSDDNTFGNLLKSGHVTLLEEIVNKKTKIRENTKKEKESLEVESESVNFKLKSVKDTICQYQRDSEHEFKSWTEKISKPNTNNKFEDSIEQLHKNICSLSNTVHSNTSLRQLTNEIHESMKKL